MLKNSNPRIIVLILILYLCFQSFLFSQDVFVQNGYASFYADKFVGRTTSNGEIYSHSELTAAHLTLNFGTKVKVTNLANNKSIVVRINDRGPFVEGRIIDLSKSAAKELDYLISGITQVKIETVNYKEETDSLSKKDIPIQKNEKIQNTGDFFKVDINKIKPKGFGIQIGCFKELNNLFISYDKLKLQHNSDIFILITKINKIQVYKLIIEQFENRSLAEQMKLELQSNYPDCFIIDYVQKD